jgi:hypothetical protein
MQMTPAAGPLLMELLKFGVRGFKVGKGIEGQFDQAVEQLKQSSMQGPPPDPKQMQEQALLAAKQQVAQENATKEIGLAKRAADLDLREAKHEAMKQVDDIKRQAEDQKRAAEVEKTQHELGMQKQDIEHTAKSADHEARMKTERASFDEERARYATETHDKVQKETAGRDEALQALVQEVAKQNAETQTALAQLVKAMSAPKRLVRGPDGRAQGVETVQ